MNLLQYWKIHKESLKFMNSPYIIFKKIDYSRVKSNYSNLREFDQAQAVLSNL